MTESLPPSQVVYPPKPLPGRNLPFSDFEEYIDLYASSIRHADKFWESEAKKNLSWITPFKKVRDFDWEHGLTTWFTGGQLNACYQCVDRHLPEKEEQVALIWEADEPGQHQEITYGELYRKVCSLANGLREFGLRKGDRVAIYMPMIPEAVYAMLACARIGAVHNVVFAGFSAESLRDRINDAQCKAVITADEGYRGGKIIPLKRTVDEAVAAAPTVHTVLVAKRTGRTVPMIPNRDFWLNEIMARHRPYAPPEPMDSEDLLFLLYTSGSTGKPKGLAHTIAGYLLQTGLTHKYVFDYRPGDVYACVADIGWITGHSYVVYGPLVNGATTLLFESTPTYPNAGRYWEMVQRHGITQFYTAPTAIRAVAKAGQQWLEKYDRSSLRILGSVGEPINPDAWKWYYESVGQSRCTVVDTWWQTETGAIMLTPLPGIGNMKPGATTYPFLGIEPVVLDEQGNELTGNNVSGLLAIKQAWPSMARTIQGDHERYIQTYLRPFKGYYLTGDGCIRDDEGAYWITGRVDDVLNVSGHRIGTAEVEAALQTHPSCAEAAVVGTPHEIKGTGLLAYIVLHEGYSYDKDLIGELKGEVRHHIGPIAIPDEIVLVPGLPKTRSGKIMRRLLRKIGEADLACEPETQDPAELLRRVENMGDISTLADPSVVEKIVVLRAQQKHSEE